MVLFLRRTYPPGGGAYRMCKKSSVTERFKIVNLLPRIATSAANTLTAITSSLKSPGGDIEIPCTYLRSSPIGHICGGRIR